MNQVYSLQQGIDYIENNLIGEISNEFYEYEYGIKSALFQILCKHRRKA